MTMTMTEANPSNLNLTMHRSEQNVWARPGWDGRKESLTPARVLIGVGGAVLALQALRYRTWSSRVLSGLGTSLAWWALTGEGDLSGVRRVVTRVANCFAAAEADDEELAGSFPASDAPASTPVTGTVAGKRS
jgi:hypothetical protein